MKSEFIRTLKFTLFSASAGIIQMVSFTLLNELLSVSYWVAYLISLILSVLWNFTLNRKYTFRSAANVPVAMAKVAVYYLIFTQSKCFNSFIYSCISVIINRSFNL